jgi:hypothetical protein
MKTILAMIGIVVLAGCYNPTGPYPTRLKHRGEIDTTIINQGAFPCVK